MLCQFSFKNFKSYKNETTFDFQAEVLSEFKESLIVEDKCSSVLPVGVIYGPNGGGKTNLLQALACLISTVVKPIFNLEKNRNKIILQQNTLCQPFMFDEESKYEPTEFRVFFRTNNYEYRYYIALLQDEVVGETLARRVIGGKKPTHIFERDKDDIKLGASINKKNINTDVNAKMPYLSFLAINYNLAEVSDAVEWFEACLIRNYGSPLAEQQIMLSDDCTFKQHIIMLLNDMGIDISNYRFDREKHQFYLQRTLKGKEYELSFNDESDGTKKLFAALPVILLALEEGRLLIIDELDAKLHPKLLRYVITMFRKRDINKHGAQLLFTSHDMATMKNTVFRRDEIWFAAENDAHESEIYSLYEIRREDNERINNTAAYDKQYMEGRYGADPYLQNMISAGNWS